jgi:hypothetical protein
MGRWQGRVAWSLCAASVLGAGTQQALLASSGIPMLDAESFVDYFSKVGLVSQGVVGALIVSRYPRHPIGWLFSISATGRTVGSVAAAYGLLAQSGEDVGPLWAGQLAVRVAGLFGGVYTLALAAILFLLVPDGRLPSRRWRPALALAVLALTLNIAIGMSMPPGPNPLRDRSMDSSFRAVMVVLGKGTEVLVLLALALAGVALVRRLRAARGEQRLQLRWIATSAVGLGAAWLILVTVETLPWAEGPPLIGVVPLVLASASVPVCTGVAILRYRLYDIDVIINRAVVLVIVAAFVTAGYVALVVLIGAALGRRVEGRFWPSLLAIAVVALAFQPVRSRVLRWADRLVYGQRAVPHEALADFSRRIGATASPAQLLRLFAEAAAHSVGARRARVRVDVPGTSGPSVSWPDGGERPDDPPGVEFAVTDRGERMGVLAVTMPPGRALRRDEQRLLEGFAEQAGLALRNVRLEAQLRARVQEAAAQSSALEASRRRLLGARDAERQRVAATINRSVLARLAPLVPALESDWRGGSGGGGRAAAPRGYRDHGHP